jgi:hypothetical protein
VQGVQENTGGAVPHKAAPGGGSDGGGGGGGDQRPMSKFKMRMMGIEPDEEY